MRSGVRSGLSFRGMNCSFSKMAAAEGGGGGKEMNEIKTQFTTREGVYKLLAHSEYSRPNRVPFNSQGSNPVKVSFVNVNDQSGNGDRVCFNVGRELYFYIYKGVRKVSITASPDTIASSPPPPCRRRCPCVVMTVTSERLFSWKCADRPRPKAGAADLARFS